MKPLDDDEPKRPAASDERLLELARKFRAEIAEVNEQEQAEFADWQRERRRWMVGGSNGLSWFPGEGGDCGGGDGGD
jgi:hypothetical protein